MLPTPSPSPPPPPPPRFRWVICSLLFAATTINYIDRQILALLKPVLDGQFHWTDTQYGAVNATFQAAYAVSVLVFGRLVDRYGTKAGYALSIAGWSLAAVGHAAVRSVGGFFAARAALGLAEGGNFPAAIKATAQWFPPRERALATALFNAGANVGAVVAPAVVPVIAVKLGWQWAFVFAGAAGFVWLGVWLPLFHVPALAGGEPARIERAVSWADVLRHRQAWAYVAAKLLTDPVWWFLLTWLPDFFHKTRGLDIKHSAPLLVTIYGIVTVLSVGGGWLSGWLIGRGWSVTAARKASLLLFAVSVVPIAAAPHVGNWPAVVLIGLAGAAHQAWSATLYTTGSDLFPKRAVGTLIGVGTAAGSAGGIAFPILAGRLLDRLPHAGYAVLFAVCAAAYLVALAAHHALAPSFEPVAFDDQ